MRLSSLSVVVVVVVRQAVSALLLLRSSSTTTTSMVTMPFYVDAFQQHMMAPLQQKKHSHQQDYNSRHRHRLPFPYEDVVAEASSSTTTKQRRRTTRIYSSTILDKDQQDQEEVVEADEEISSVSSTTRSVEEQNDIVTIQEPDNTSSSNRNKNNDKNRKLRIVLVAGFESFNRELYEMAATRVTEHASSITSDGSSLGVELSVFADSDIRERGGGGAAAINPKFQSAMEHADAFIGSLIFDYDDVQIVESLLSNISGPRLIFESATELMSYNRMGTFSMMAPMKKSSSALVGGDDDDDEDDDREAITSSKPTPQPGGAPPAVKKILKLFNSGKEEDKINGYLKLLKIGPTLLKFIPGQKVNDLRLWMESYRYWNQGGLQNVQSMFQIIIYQTYKEQLRQQEEQTSSSSSTRSIVKVPQINLNLPELQVTPDIALIHPLTYDPRPTLGHDKMKKKENHDGYPNDFNSNPQYFHSPSTYLQWRLSDQTQAMAKEHNFILADSVTAPRVALLLYRKHVITEQRYVWDLIQQLESHGIMPIPIFINGVEAHTIVRDLLTSYSEIRGVQDGTITRDTTYQPDQAIRVDAIVNTIGFPLVGGPAGSMQAGRNLDVSATLLRNMNIPYIVASPLLLQSIPQWKQNGVLGLQSVVLYSLPELDGAIDTVILGGLVGDHIALVPERVRKLSTRVQNWVTLRRTPPVDRTIAISIYGFPPNVGAVGTAALLDVPQSLEKLLYRLHEEGYNVGEFCTTPEASGESLVAALSVLCENPVIARGAINMQQALDDKIQRAHRGDKTIPSTLSKSMGGLGGAIVRAMDITWDELEQTMGSYMMKKVNRAWPQSRQSQSSAPGISSKGNLVVAGLQLGNIWITVQPLLGVEGDPMRLLFERDLTPHPQYCASYEYMRKSIEEGGIGAQAVIHLGMHGTVEWLPGQPLGNDRQSWSDEIIGPLPHIYVYAANNPSESILAKRRGYGTLVSYNVPPYGRAGLYLELANLKDLVTEYRSSTTTFGSEEKGGNDDNGDGNNNNDLRAAIWNMAQRSGMFNDVPLLEDPSDLGSAVTHPDLPDTVTKTAFDEWIVMVSDYLVELQERLFSSGLHVLGAAPTDQELFSYLEAYFGDKLTEEDINRVISEFRLQQQAQQQNVNPINKFVQFLHDLFAGDDDESSGASTSEEDAQVAISKEASEIVSLLSATTEEMDSVVNALDGGYVPAAPGGDLLRDGPSVLPTGRNIHALDPYRMPSAGAWARGQRIAAELIRQHQEANGGKYPETIAVTLWGLDAIKTRGESVAIALALAGAKPVQEGTGRIVRFDLVSLDELGRPRIDVLASLSGIFRDSFANIVDLLDDMFERAAIADKEPIEMNFIKKHAQELSSEGVERPAARLFSNPPGDYGSMVNEVVGTGDWKESESLGETWTSRNTFSYGRNEGGMEKAGKSRPEVLDKLLATTERIVQEVDSIEYGVTDIQEYYANTGALKKASENRKGNDPVTGKKKKVTLSVVEAFTGSSAKNDDTSSIPVRNVEDVLRLEYRSKLLNPKWRDSMLRQGSGGAYEVSQRMTAMVGWAATTSDVDNFVFDQAAERYALDDDVAQKLQQSNPEAFKNVVRRLLEASGRGMWDTDEETLDKLRELYSDADDQIEQGSAR